MSLDSIRLVCIDVDGTLVGASGEVPPAVWPAAERLREAGVRLAVCSGRPGFGHARDHARRLDAGGWHVFQSGASIVRADGGASRSTVLPDQVVDALLARAARTGLAIELYGDDAYGVAPGADAGKRARRHAELLGVPYAASSLDELRAAAGGPIVRAQWLLAHDELPAVLAEPVAGARPVPSLSPVMPDTTFVSMVAADVDKVMGVATVAATYGIPLAEVMFVGDGANDAAAMAAVGAAGGWPVAMGNGEAEALAVARHVVGHVDDGGLVEALTLALDARARESLGGSRVGG